MDSEGLLARCCQVAGREASPNELRHAHIHAIEAVQHLDSQADVDDVASQYESVFLTKGSNRCARIAAGSVLELVQLVAAGTLCNGLAAVRPPGHHADADQCWGFCVFNNVALAAAVARERYGMKKVLIVDWDVYHGNGTQRMFEDDPTVLYFLVHRYDSGDFVPGSRDAAPDKVGCDAGEGFKVSVVWSIAWTDRWTAPAMTNIWLFGGACSCLLLRIAYMILVSAGFDAAKGDVAGCSLTPGCFAQLINTHVASRVLLQGLSFDA